MTARVKAGVQKLLEAMLAAAKEDGVNRWLCHRADVCSSVIPEDIREDVRAETVARITAPLDAAKRLFVSTVVPGVQFALHDLAREWAGGEWVEVTFPEAQECRIMWLEWLVKNAQEGREGDHDARSAPGE